MSEEQKKTFAEYTGLSKLSAREKLELEFTSIEKETTRMDSNIAKVVKQAKQLSYDVKEQELAMKELHNESTNLKDSVESLADLFKELSAKHADETDELMTRVDDLTKALMAEKQKNLVLIRNAAQKVEAESVKNKKDFEEKLEECERKIQEQNETIQQQEQTIQQQEQTIQQQEETIQQQDHTIQKLHEKINRAKSCLNDIYSGDADEDLGMAEVFEDEIIPHNDLNDDLSFSYLDIDSPGISIASDHE